MKTSPRTLSARINELNNNMVSKMDMNSLTKKERSALKVIYSHAGKRFVFETYSASSPEMAQKYLQFVSKNPWEIYIKWDKDRNRFVA